MVGTCGVSKEMAERLAGLEKNKKPEDTDGRFVYGPDSKIQTMEDIYKKK